MLIQNAIKIIENPDNPFYLVSYFRHDYVSHQFKDGSNVFIDGGCRGGEGGYYFRSNGDLNRANLCENWMLYEDSDFEMIKSKLLWGTRGKDGKDKLRWVPLINCETEHLNNIVLSQNLNKLTEKVIYGILEDRKEMKEV